MAQPLQREPSKDDRPLCRELSKEDQSMKNKMVKVFSAFDTDGSNTLDIQEIRIGLMRFGLGSSDKDVRQMLKDMDKNGDGVIDIDEWIEHMNIEVRKKLSAAFDRMGVNDGKEKEVSYDMGNLPKCDSPRFCKTYGIENEN